MAAKTWIAPGAWCPPGTPVPGDVIDVAFTDATPSGADALIGDGFTFVITHPVTFSLADFLGTPGPEDPGCVNITLTAGGGSTILWAGNDNAAPTFTVEAGSTLRLGGRAYFAYITVRGRLELADMEYAMGSAVILDGGTLALGEYYLDVSEGVQATADSTIDWSGGALFGSLDAQGHKISHVNAQSPSIDASYGGVYDFGVEDEAPELRTLIFAQSGGVSILLNSPLTCSIFGWISSHPDDYDTNGYDTHVYSDFTMTTAFAGTGKFHLRAVPADGETDMANYPHLRIGSIEGSGPRVDLAGVYEFGGSNQDTIIPGLDGSGALWGRNGKSLYVRPVGDDFWAFAGQINAQSAPATVFIDPNIGPVSNAAPIILGNKLSLRIRGNGNLVSLSDVTCRNIIVGHTTAAAPGAQAAVGNLRTSIDAQIGVLSGSLQYRGTLTLTGAAYVGGNVTAPASNGTLVLTGTHLHLRGTFSGANGLTVTVTQPETVHVQGVGATATVTGVSPSQVVHFHDCVNGGGNGPNALFDVHTPPGSMALAGCGI